MRKGMAWTIVAAVMALGCLPVACAVHNSEQSTQGTGDGLTIAARQRVDDLALGLKTHTVKIATQEQFIAAVRVMRDAFVAPMETADGSLLIIARDGGQASAPLAMEAIAQLCARGKAREEIRGFVEGWRTDRERATASMYMLALDATDQELETFDRVRGDAFHELPTPEYGSVAFYSSFGRTVSEWSKTLPGLDDKARVQEIARWAKPIAGCYKYDANVESYWNPMSRRAALELRKQYRLDPQGTLTVLREMPLLSQSDPGCAPGFDPTDLDERKNLEDKLREGLVSLLPADARPIWESIKH